MRWAVRLPACLGGLSLAVAGCTPRENLEAYSAGGQLSRDDPLRPSPSEVANDPELMSTDQPASEADLGETAPNPEAPAQPVGLGGETGEGEGAPANGGDPESDEPANDEPASDEEATPEAPEAEPEPPTPEAVPPSEPPAAPEFRFVRLVADSDVTEGPLTSIAELGVLGTEGQPLARNGWVASADSSEQTYVGGAPPSMAIDGDANTMWHTPWFEVVPPPHPHFIQIDLGQPQRVGGFRYLARQDGALDGRVAAYRFYVSADGEEWGEPVAAGNLANSVQPQDVRLAAP